MLIKRIYYLYIPCQLATLSFLSGFFISFQQYHPIRISFTCLLSAIDSCGRVLLTDGSTEDVIMCY